jgi:hypothetical protein
MVSAGCAQAWELCVPNRKSPEEHRLLPGKRDLKWSRAGKRSARADPVDPLNRDQVTFDYVHDPVPADTKPEHVSPPEGSRRIRISGQVV